MSNLYKLRFLPLIFFSLVLAVLVFLKYVVYVHISSFILNWSLGLTVVSFIFLQAMREWKRDLESHEPKTIELKDERIFDNAEYKLKNEIPFLGVRAFMSGLLFLMGFSLIFSNNEILFGIVMIILGGFLCYLHIYWIRQNIKGLKEIKKVKKEDI